LRRRGVRARRAKRTGIGGSDRSDQDFCFFKDSVC
jgi:hypothetical protein